MYEPSLQHLWPHLRRFLVADFSGVVGIPRWLIETNKRTFDQENEFDLFKALRYAVMFFFYFFDFNAILLEFVKEFKVLFHGSQKQILNWGKLCKRYWKYVNDKNISFSKWSDISVLANSRPFWRGDTGIILTQIGHSIFVPCSACLR